MSEQAKIQTSQAVIVPNETFLQTADQLKPVIHRKETFPTQIVEVSANVNAIHGWGVAPVGGVESLTQRIFGKGESMILDFGDHRVGHLSFDVKPIGSPPDAPLKMKVTFGEMPVEMAEPFDQYEGWISSSWLQEELLLIDVLPQRIELPRRYSFRYVKFEVLDTSPKYRVSFDHIMCTTVTSANAEAVTPLGHSDPVLECIDRVSIRTLEDCMQDVFEDGPKRDRRLWLGDLRLQALANYVTFKNMDLVKRCLYLFAGVPDQQGRVTANLFIEPSIIADDTYLYDYSLFFTATLYDYYEATNDRITLNELWPTARRQVELALERLDQNGIVRDDDTWWSFIDWHEQLNKQAPSQGVLIYTMKRAFQLANEVDSEYASILAGRIREVEALTVHALWDPKLRFFISGAERQVSWASQVWMVLAEVLPAEEGRALLMRLLEECPSVGMTTPYMYHHFVEALLIVGCKEEAVAQIKAYWGGMVADGAVTFWELYDPDNKNFSPYGSNLINSYCHAWSCTPTYLIRRYGL